jgi:hypothetical protein
MNDPRESMEGPPPLGGSPGRYSMFLGATTHQVAMPIISRAANPLEATWVTFTVSSLSAEIVRQGWLLSSL